MFCPKCGKEIADNSKFCPECGENLSGDSSNKSSELHESRELGERKQFPFGHRYYTKEQRLNPKNKKKNHVWLPPIWVNNYKNTQVSYYWLIGWFFFAALIIYLQVLSRI